MFDLFTSRYQTFRPTMGVPVRTTVGAPRFKLNYPLVHSVREIAPSARALGLPYAPFRDAYFAKLAKTGAQKIAARLDAVAAAEGERRLVLLCFDDLSKPDGWCHRTLFAEWWQKQTGQVVREIGLVADPPTYEQLGLF